MKWKPSHFQNHLISDQIRIGEYVKSRLETPGDSSVQRRIKLTSHHQHSPVVVVADRVEMDVRVNTVVPSHTTTKQCGWPTRKYSYINGQY